MPGAGIGGGSDDDRSGVPEVWRRAFSERPVFATVAAHDSMAAIPIPNTSRSRALLARVHGDEARYRDYRDRYRAMARSLGFEGHMKWAEEMP